MNVDLIGITVKEIQFSGIVQWFPGVGVAVI
jgi:hypothetical protein